MFLVAIDHVNTIVMTRHMRRHCHLTPLKYLGQLPSLQGQHNNAHAPCQQPTKHMLVSKMLLVDSLQNSGEELVC